MTKAPICYGKLLSNLRAFPPRTPCLAKSGNQPPAPIGNHLASQQEQVVVDHLPLVRFMPGVSTSDCLAMCRLMTSTVLG
jgi:hypothetical protein